jgi:acyl-CoA synthetase (AMP-forming)/AMP-acid ligase II
VGSPWGDDVVADRYDGHPGLVYAQRPRTFAELLFGVERWAQRTFLVHGDRRISFGEFFTAVRGARDMLAPLGIQRGDRVLLLAYNSPEWVLALWAIWSLGAVPVLGNRWWSPREADHCVALVEPAAVITDAPDLTGRAAAVVDIAELRDCLAGAGLTTPGHPRAAG